MSKRLSHTPGMIAALAMLLFATPRLLAQDSEYPHVYDEDDSMLDEKLEIEHAFGLYLVAPPRRHISEQVDIKRDRVTVRYWYSLGPSPEQVACDGLQWMLFGRHQWAGGIRKLQEETDYSEFNLEFIHVLRKRGGGLPGPRDFRRFQEIRLSAKKAQAIDFPAATHIAKTGEGCVDFIRSNFDRYYFDSRFYEREIKRL